MGGRLMGMNMIRVIRLWLFLVSEQLLVFPIVAILCNLSGLTRTLQFLLQYLLIDLLAMMARELLPKSWRPRILTVGIAFTVVLCAWMSPVWLFRGLAPLLLSLVLWHGIRMIDQGHPSAYFTSYILMGFLLYPLTVWLLHRIDAAHPLLSVLPVSGTAGILLALVLLNRQQIRDAGTVLERRLHIPGVLMRKNALYLAVFSALLLAGSAWGFFARLVMGLFDGAARLLVKFYQWYASLLATNTQNAGPAQAAAPEDALMGADEEPALWAQILEKIVVAVALLGLLALVLWGLYRLSKQIRPMLKRLRAWLAIVLEGLKTFFIGDRQAIPEDPGFVDEVESLLHNNESTLTAARRWLSERLTREPGYGAMKSDRERIRWLYRNLLRREAHRGFEADASMTPTETMHLLAGAHDRRERSIRPPQNPEAVARLYGQARYADHEPDPNAVHEMKQACE